MSWRPSIPLEDLLRGMRPLRQPFFARDTATVARELLGCVVVAGNCAGRIVETEAYLNETDLASHAAPGPTSRNGLMFGPAGILYVYFIYGMYHCMNVVTERSGVAGAVLFRALEPLSGIETMQTRRPKVVRWQDLASGPGKLTLALGVGLRDNGSCVVPGHEPSSIAIYRQIKKRAVAVAISPRVGITKCADLPLRFFEQGNPCVSRTPLNALASTVVQGQSHQHRKEEPC